MMMMMKQQPFLCLPQGTPNPCPYTNIYLYFDSCPSTSSPFSFFSSLSLTHFLSFTPFLSHPLLLFFLSSPISKEKMLNIRKGYNCALPNGSDVTLSVDKERFHCCEVLFQPSIFQVRVVITVRIRAREWVSC